MTAPTGMMARTRIRALLAAIVFALATFALPQSAEANVVCSPGSYGLNFGGSTSGTGTIAYTCHNYNPTSVTMTLCVGIGNPSWPGIATQPILLAGESRLSFNVFRDPAATDIWTQQTPIMKTITIGPSSNGSPVTVSGTFTFYGRIAPGQSVPAQQYQAFFYNTVLGFVPTGSSVCQNSSGDRSGQMFTLPINATVGNNCTVSTTGPVNLGTVLPSTVNVAGSTTIRVTCPTGTPYFIGLRPSNGNSAGAGQLTGSVGNPDRPPYQLRSGSSVGPVWGNTATTTSVGNGVAGTGNGAVQNHSAHVTMPSANFRPDTYTDTVTVTLNY